MVKAMTTRKKNAAESTAQRHEQLREALLRAAERTIETAGYQALRARSLAEDVGCAGGEEPHHRRPRRRARAGRGERRRRRRLGRAGGDPPAARAGAGLSALC